MIKMMSESFHRIVLQVLSTLFCVSLLINIVTSRPQTIFAGSDESKENLNILLQKLLARTAKSLDINSSPRFTPKAENFAECANGSTFCETIKDYPSSHINDMFIQEALKQQFDAKYEVEINPVEVENEPEKKPLCTSRTNFIYPNITQKDETTGKTKVFLMKKGMEVEECIQSGSCSVSEKMPDGFKAVCKQKYVYTNLPMTDEDGIESKQQYLLPSGCVCSLKTIENGLKLKDTALLLLNEYLTKP